MSRDLYHNVKRVTVIAPQSLGATAAGGKTGKVIDRNGFDAVVFEFDFGVVTATNATVGVEILEGDATGSLTAAASGNVQGTQSGEGILAGTPRASGVNMNVSKRLGYIGSHRYVSAKLTPGVSGGIIASCAVVLGAPHYMPVASQ